MAAFKSTMRNVTVECPACGDDLDVEVTFERVIHTGIDQSDNTIQLAIKLVAGVDFDLETSGHLECYAVSQDTIDSVIALQAELDGEGQ